MDTEVVSKHGFKLTVYDIGDGKIRFCLSEKYNPRILNARDPVFNGSMKECIDYINQEM